MHFVKKHIVVLLPILVKPVTSGLQEYFVSKLTLIYDIVVQGYLNIVRGVKTIEQIAVSEENTLLFRSVRSVVCYVGKRIGDGVVVRAYLKNVLAADVFVGNGILYRTSDLADFVLDLWLFSLFLLCCAYLVYILCGACRKGLF